MSMNTQISIELMRYTLLSFELLVSLRHTMYLVRYALIQKQEVEIYPSILFFRFFVVQVPAN